MDPYRINTKAKVPAPALRAILAYLSEAPEGAGVSREAHHTGLAGGILSALDAAGLEVVPALGQADWIWQPGLGMHTPCCGSCGCLLADWLIPTGQCETCLTA